VTDGVFSAAPDDPEAGAGAPSPGGTALPALEAGLEAAHEAIKPFLRHVGEIGLEPREIPPR